MDVKRPTASWDDRYELDCSQEEFEFISLLIVKRYKQLSQDDAITARAIKEQEIATRMIEKLYGSSEGSTAPSFDEILEELLGKIS